MSQPAGTYPPKWSEIYNCSKPYRVICKVLLFVMYGASLVAAGMPIVLGAPVPPLTPLLLLAALFLETVFTWFLASILFSYHLIRLIHHYAADCDPEAFLRKGRSAIEVIEVPKCVADGIFLCQWARALHDVGRDDEARQTMERVLEATLKMDRPKDRAMIFMHAHYVQYQLDGKEAALTPLDLSEAATLENPKKCKQDIVYVERARMRHAAVEAGPAEAARYWRMMRESSKQSLREKVEAAFREAEALGALGQEDARKEALSFAAKNGPKLKFGRQAAELLAETDGSGG